MGGQSYVSLAVLLVLFCGFIFCSHGLEFIVGGKDHGWGLNPPEDYNRWAQRLRFQVNDTLLFNYKRGSDSVVVVSKDDYNECNTTTANPTAKLDDGNSVFKFDRSGPFYFISGNKTSCDHGQKLVVVVLAVRNNSSPPPKSPISASPPKSSIPPSSPQVDAPAPGPDASNVPSSGDSTPAPPHPHHHKSFAAAAWSPSIVVVSMVWVLVSVCLGGF